jgi:hypothetical protein
MKRAWIIVSMSIAALVATSNFGNLGSAQTKQISPNLPLGPNKESLSSQASFSDQLPAVTSKKILIYGPSMWPFPPNEQSIATAQGHLVTVVTAATWSSLGTADFKQFDAIVFGDANCSIDVSVLTSAVANKADWSSAITGPEIVIGTDPIFHLIRDGLVGAQKLIVNGINFAASGPGTGLYADLSCYYAGASPATQVDFLTAIGDFRVQGQGDCPQLVTIVQPSHPAMANISSAELSNWGCSVHEFVTSFPPAFSVLATSLSLPYIIAAQPPLFDLCIQDDSSSSTLRINSTTGDYSYTNCSGLSLVGTGALIIKGSVLTLQHYASDRRVVAKVDSSVNKAVASIQILSLGTTFTITDRNTQNNTCTCP